MHLLPLGEAPTQNLVNRRFDERGANRFSLPVSLPVVRDGFLIVSNIGLELRHARREFRGWCGGDSNEFESMSRWCNRFRTSSTLPCQSRCLTLSNCFDAPLFPGGASCGTFACCCRTVSRIVM